jgi:hypothetical protein
MASRSRRRILLAFGSAVAFLLVVAVLIPAIPPNEASESEVLLCVRCGMRRYVRATTTLNSPPRVLASHDGLKPTALSDWHEEHFSDACCHLWRINHHSSRQYRRVGSLVVPHIAEMGGSVTPRLVAMDDDDRALLETLFAVSPGLCQLYIEGFLQPRGT